MPSPWPEDRLLFYLNPFLAKWRKTFPQFRLGVVSKSAIQSSRWQQTLKAGSVDWVPLDELTQDANFQWDVAVLVCDDLQLTQILDLMAHLAPYGMVLLVSQNLHSVWPQWVSVLQDSVLERLFTVGVAPQGGAAWWPWHGAMMFSHVADFMQSLFPGKSQTNLRYGQAWIVQGFRPYAQTHLAGKHPDLPAQVAQ